MGRRLDAGQEGPEGTCGARTLRRRAGAWPAVWACALILTSGCDRVEERAADRAATAGESGPSTLIEAGDFAAGGGVLYLWEAGRLEAIAALPGAGPAPDTLERCVEAIPRLGEEGFQRLVLSPDRARAAWQTVGPGACVGVVEGVSGDAWMLGRWSAAVPDSLIWSPGGRHLAVLLMHPDARRSLAVFDARGGRRLNMPWEAECQERPDCDVSRVEWLGGSLLNVEIRQGPAELSVPYEVNVSMAGSAPG